MKYLICIVIIQTLIIILYILAKVKQKKNDILDGLDINTFNKKIESLENEVEKKEELIKLLDKKLKDVTNEKEPDTIDELVTMFNNITS